MTYIPTEWQTGDIVTAEKLNKLENGVLSANVPEQLVVTIELNYNNIDEQWEFTAEANMTPSEVISNGIVDGYCHVVVSPPVSDNMRADFIVIFTEFCILRNPDNNPNITERVQGFIQFHNNYFSLNELYVVGDPSTDTWSAYD